MERLTKIVATLGPAVASRDRVRDLIRAGMDVARLNFSHGEHDTHRQMSEWVRQGAEEEGRNVALLQDIQGPKLRVGSFPGGAVGLQNEEEITLRPGRELAEPGTVYLDYDHLLEDVQAGEKVLLADGLIRLRVEEAHPDRLEAVVIQGGVLTDGKGVAFPDTHLRVPAITEKDEGDLVFGRELDFDYVAASFVRTSSDLAEISEKSGGKPVIAKIELAAAYANLDDILTRASGAMVARGDLGVQLPLEQLPLVQADILERTNSAGLISITATEMLESMTKAPRPTRAEVTDVATAVLAGTDAVMLSAETAIGDFPIEAVEMMGRICSTVESGRMEWLHVAYIGEGKTSVASAIARAAVEVSENLGIDTIVAFTESGNTARLLSKYRPLSRIIAFAPDPGTVRRMALYRGVQAKMFGRRDYTDVMFAAAEKALEREGICERGDAVVMVAGTPPNVQASTNLLKTHVIGERDRGAMSRKAPRPAARGDAPE